MEKLIKTLEEITKWSRRWKRCYWNIWGPIAALKTFKQDEDLKRKIEEMKEHERTLWIFDNEIRKEILSQQNFYLFGFNGVTLGFGTAMLGKTAAMLCTASVEEVIDKHYEEQTYKLKEEEKKLKSKIEKFRQDELDHKDIAYDNGATKKGPYKILDKVIKTSSRILSMH